MQNAAEQEEMSDSSCSGDNNSSDSNSSQDEASSGLDWRLEELHPHSCVESREDFKRMEKKLQWDPYSLNRAQESENLDLPLHVAIYCQHIKCVRFLLDEGASVDQENYEGLKPIGKAINNACYSKSYFEIINSTLIIKMLLKLGSDVNYSGHDYESTYFLTKIIKFNKFDNDILKLLLEYGAQTEDLEAIKSGQLYYETPLYETFALCEEKMAKLLFIHGAIMNIHKLPYAKIYSSTMTPILHQMLQNFTLDHSDICIKMLNLYKEFGGDFYIKYKAKTALEYLKTEFPFDKDWSGFDLMLETFTSNPLSLQSLSRLAVRLSMGREFRSNISKLHVPKELKQSLKFKFD